MTQKEQILSIKQLTRFIKMKLESDELLQNVWIRGEISNFTHHSSGHMYFTLKDPDSRVKCIMFASQNQRLSFLPKEGSRVLARGNISIYERDGQYQFYIQQMQPDGIGSLFLAYEQLKKKLELEGLFHPEVKKPLPRFPKAIGVITSPTGAAVRDIMITLQRRFPAIPILLYPVLVQGTQAAGSIAKAIQKMNELNEVDVLIVGRGGGSLEELWAFNEEVVARSIFNSLIPIISAVGHETDFTIADFVADVRAATPTAAAELAVPHLQEVQAQLLHLQKRMEQGLKKQLTSKKEKLDRLRKSPVLLYPERQLLQPAERLDRLKETLRFAMQKHVNRSTERWIKLQGRLMSRNPREQVLYARKRKTSLHAQMVRAMNVLHGQAQQKWVSIIRELDALSPLKVMQRGYSLLYDEQEQQLIKSTKQVQLGDSVKIKVTDGTLHCQVWSMEGQQ